MPGQSVAEAIAPTDGQNLQISQDGRTVPETNLAEVMTAMDSTPIDPTIQAHLDSLSAGDLDLLADTYHPEAILILNKPLARISQATGSATGRADIKSLLQRQIDAGTKFLELRDYVQGKDLAIVRSTLMIGGLPRDFFAYYLLRDGKIWRHIAGIYESGEPGESAMPAAFHPVFMEQMGLLAGGDIDGLARTYDPDAIWVWAATNSPIARVRGASQGYQPIRHYLGKYVKLNMQMVGLKEYTQIGDTLFVQAIMTARGMSEHASGAYVFAGNKIWRQASSCGPRAA
jgi:hypothetical protein